MPIRLKLYSILVANSVLIYDHMATITDEITFIWCRPKALSAILFLINRYVALFGNVYMLSVYLLPIMSHEVLWFRYARTQLAGSHLLSAEVSTLVLSMCCFSQQRPSCRTYFTSKDLLFFSQQIFVCFILTLRTYALYCRNKRLLILMIIIVCALAGVTVGTFGLRSRAVVPGLNCLDSYAKYIAVSPGLGWVTLLIYELLVFVLTVCRICKIRALSLAISRGHMLDIMFQDGVMYFAVMTLSNLLNILTYYCGSKTTRGSMATFTSCISVTLVSRLMLNLHKSVDTGILTTPVQDDDYDSIALTTRINVQSTISSPQC